MSEYPTPSIVGHVAEGRDAHLTPERIASILEDFRDWLGTLPAMPDAESVEIETGPDRFSLISEMTALRHEVNLQTKAARSQQEQNAATLLHLTQALDTARQSGKSAEEHLRPLLKTLIELHDALFVAGRETRRLLEAVRPALEQAAMPLDGSNEELPPCPTVPKWKRWLGIRVPDFAPFLTALAARRERVESQARLARDASGRVLQFMDSLSNGYAMSIQRVERALSQHGLQPIAAVGQPFDPEAMEVVEGVLDSGRPAGEVLEDVRRGYRWNGRLFRHSLVRVAKGS